MITTRFLVCIKKSTLFLSLLGFFLFSNIACRRVLIESVIWRGLENKAIVTEGRTNSIHNLTKPYVVLVSIDGFRWDYAQKYKASNLLAIKQQGAIASSLIPVFPSKTFPNHYGMATGLYPGTHGIIGNFFYDPHIGRYYSLRNKKELLDQSWYNGWPLWSVAEKQQLLSASFFWPGSEVIQDFHPTYYYKFDKKIPKRQRVLQIIRWLKLSVHKRPHFLTLYFEEVDDNGHKFGTDSQEVANAIQSVDKEIGFLWSEIKKLNLPINLVIVSDHGMLNVNHNKEIVLDKILTKKQFQGFQITDTGPVVSLYALTQTIQSGLLEETYKVLKSKEYSYRYRVYKCQPNVEFPPHLLKSIEIYKGHCNPRFGNIVLSAEPPFYIKKTSSDIYTDKGNHGWDPLLSKDMGGIFFAIGPQIKKGKRLGIIENIHIYPFVLNMLGLQNYGHQASSAPISDLILEPIKK